MVIPNKRHSSSLQLYNKAFYLNTVIWLMLAQWISALPIFLEDGKLQGVARPFSTSTFFHRPWRKMLGKRCVSTEFFVLFWVSLLVFITFSLFLFFVFFSYSLDFHICIFLLSLFLILAILSFICQLISLHDFILSPSPFCHLQPKLIPWVCFCCPPVFSVSNLHSCFLFIA